MTKESPQYILAHQTYLKAINEGKPKEQASKEVFDKYGGKVFSLWLMAIASGLLRTDNK
jgi:hypothetical protein